MRHNKMTKYFVSRQSYCFADEPIVVEIATGGRDYANPDMLSDKYHIYRALGCDMEYVDPREALGVAIEVRDLWIKNLKPEADCAPRIEVGYTGGNTIPFEDYPDDEWLRAWAEARWQETPKCSQCGDPMPENDRDWWTDGLGSDEHFCSEYCVEKYMESLDYDPWGGEEVED